MIYLIFELPMGGVLFLSAFVIGIFFKVFTSLIYENLKWHGFFTYEIGAEKVVRYSTTNYQIFHLDDLEIIQEKKIGLVLIKKSNLWKKWNLSAYFHK